MSGTFHLLPADDACQGGSGTASDPLRIQSPGHFDRVLAATGHSGCLSQVQTLVLRSGVYLTRGCWNLPGYTLPRPFTLQGETGTIIRLCNDPLFPARPDTRVLQLGIPNTGGHGWVLRDLCIDGNEAVLPPSRVVTAGLHIWSNDPILENVVVQGLRGTHNHPETGLNYESFGVLLNNGPSSTPGPDGGARLTGVKVMDNGSPYFSGIYPGLTRQPSRAFLPVVLRNCHVQGTGPSPSRLAFSFQARTHYFGCSAGHVEYAFYNDTGVVEDCLAENCYVTDLAYCALCLSCAPAPGNPAPSKIGIRLTRSTFLYTPVTSTPWIGFWADDSRNTRARLDHIRIDDCSFDCPASPAKPFFVVSADSRNLGSVQVTSRMPEDWSTHYKAGTTNSRVDILRS